MHGPDNNGLVGDFHQRCAELATHQKIRVG
jgi:hypothetical protein